ncbi:hypothetical protein, partial [Tenacibaculum sp. L6]
MNISNTIKIIIILLIISCQKKSGETRLIPDVKTQKVYFKKVMSKINKAKNSVFYQPNGGERIESDSTVTFVEIHEDLNDSFQYSIRELEYIVVNNYSDNEYSSKFFITNKDSILLVVKTSDVKNKIQKDTFLFKENKLYFWKNKQVTQKEMLEKE